MATIEVDVRGLEPPEPLERILTLIDLLGVDDCLRVKIDRRPVPLFRILERNGFTHVEEPGTDALLEITIRRRAASRPRGS